MKNNTLHSHRKRYALDQPIESFINHDKDASCIYWKTYEGHYIDCNDLFVEWSGKNISRANILNKTDHDVPVCQKGANNFRKHDLFVMNNGEPTIFIEPTKLPATNKPIACLSFKAPLQDSANHLLGLFGISIVIHDQYQLDFDLIKPFVRNHYAYNLTQSFLALALLAKHKITKREAETLYYFMRCKTIKEMARQMGNLSPKTIEEYLDKCRKKLKANASNEMLSMLWDTNFAYVSISNIHELFI